MHTWTRAEDHRVVTLVGTAHVAEAGYFQALAAFVAAVQADGAVVHFEGGDPAPEDVLDTLVEREREAYRVLGSAMSGLDRLGVAAGLVHQRDGLPEQDDWVNTDVTALDMIRMLGPRTILARADRERADRLGELVDHQRTVRSVRWLLRNLGHVTRVTDLWSRSATSGLTLDWRNAIAASAALAVPAGSHVVAIWGCKHLPGIGELLARNDFVLEDVRWFTAMTR